MSGDTRILPEDPAVLKAMIAALQAENAKMAATIKAHDLLIQTLQMRIAKLKKQAFGKSSEKIEREIEQLELALEDLLIAGAESATTPADDDVADADLELTTGDVDAGKPRRRPRVAATTPRERRELDPGSCCPDCGGDLRLVGEDMSEMLDLVAAQLRVLQIARLKKSCRRCEKMVQTPAPSRPIPGSMASAALLAWILVSKFDDHLPSVIGRVWSMAMTVQRAGPYFCPWSARRHKMRTVEVGMLQSFTSASRQPWVDAS